MNEKLIYTFGDGKAEGGADMRALLGGKGANLAEMSNLGLPVPPGFTITTEVCSSFYSGGKKLPDEIDAPMQHAIASMERIMGLRFGDTQRPMLVSVRSGARASMPGMMDTVLNLGLNDEAVSGLAAMVGDERFAWDSYRRFIQMFGSVVMGVNHVDFENAIEDYKIASRKEEDTDMDAEDWQAVTAVYRKIVRDHTGDDFPQDAHQQLRLAIEAVFRSWHNPRADAYRQLHDISVDWGTAVNVQAMVFGNLGGNSATGVLFTRDPSSGEKMIYGEYLPNAQGEDVVAGIRTPYVMGERQRELRGDVRPSLESTMPEIWSNILEVASRLESHFGDMQDIEFTVQEGRLWLLQTRNGKRTGQASVAIAIALEREGLISKQEALLRVEPKVLDQLLHPVLFPTRDDVVLCTGLPASPGAASGHIALSAAQAEQMAAAGVACILVRAETNPDDIRGMNAAQGILTARGGMTSHAAVVARGLGTPCVCGASAVVIDRDGKGLTIGGHEFTKGDYITIDGISGKVYRGAVNRVEPDLGDDFATLMRWADETRKLGVRANADTPADVKTAIRFGAEGVGLCRTEHMFFEGTRIQAVRRMILAQDDVQREAALAEIEPMQVGDFAQLFEILAGKPITIRLLDPPLHEFLPHGSAEIAELARSLQADEEDIRRRIDRLSEVNPMLGHRGCRIGISYPAIYRMQVRAILTSAITCKAAATQIEIMVPLVMRNKELAFLRGQIEAVAREVAAQYGHCPPFIVGTMIELPRAALRAGAIAREAEFFSFGTNDLTQTTLGLSRDDSAAILSSYLERGIFRADPFVTLDQNGVGALVESASRQGRATKPELKLGACGEHGGDPASIEFFARAGLDYVSCSPYRVPIARLAAARAALRC